MPEEIGIFEAMFTQRAIRYLKQDPVPEELIIKLVESATKAPSGTNRQPWKFIVIRSPELKRKIGEYYKRSWDAAHINRTTTSLIDPSIMASAAYLAQHIHQVPVLILACIEHDGSFSTMSRGASIYPAVQNLLLAARGLGLGSALTSLHKRYENEIKQLLSIPDNVETAALLPVGYLTERARYGPTKRRPVEEVIGWDRWED